MEAAPEQLRLTLIGVLKDPLPTSLEQLKSLKFVVGVAAVSSESDDESELVSVEDGASATGSEPKKPPLDTAEEVLPDSDDFEFEDFKFELDDPREDPRSLLSPEP